MVQVNDAYGNVTEGKIVKIGRKYVYVEIDWDGYSLETVPFERLTGRTAQNYEDRYNALPMHLQR